MFLEEVLGSKTRSSNTNQERLKRRSLKLTRPISMVVAKIDPKKNPGRILQCDYSVIANTKDIETLSALWKLLRRGSPENEG